MEQKNILILSGVFSTLTEMSFLGHTIEQIKIVKQATGDSYPKIVKEINVDFRKNGIIAFYRGYYPWGVLQCIKGAPVLFLQDIVNNKLQTDYRSILSSTNNDDDIKMRSNIIGGLCGGFGQAVILTPLQRLKTEVLTSNGEKINFFKTKNLYNGFAATSMKRSLDWGFRFAGISEFKKQYPEFSETNSGRFVGGIVGGLFSLVTTPLEVIIAMMQKHKSSHTNSFQIIKEIGFQQMTRGMCFKILDSCYHTSMIMFLSPLYTNAIRNIMNK